MHHPASAHGVYLKHDTHMAHMNIKREFTRLLN